MKMVIPLVKFVDCFFHFSLRFEDFSDQSHICDLSTETAILEATLLMVVSLALLLGSICYISIISQAYHREWLTSEAGGIVPLGHLGVGYATARAKNTFTCLRSDS